jgi:hypothetical protein
VNGKGENAANWHSEARQVEAVPVTRDEWISRTVRALYRNRVKTPATTTRNQTAYSIGLGPAAWRTAVNGVASWLGVILTLRNYR